MELNGVGLCGVLFGFSAIFLLRQNESKYVPLVFGLAMMQTAVGVYFYLWAQSNTTDSSLYYYDRLLFRTRGFGLGTQFIVWSVQGMKNFFGGSYLDYFLVFQSLGTWGCAFLLKAFLEICANLDVAPGKLPFLILMLPGMHFWSAFIGKDGLLFLGAAMAGWAALAVHRRWLAFAIAIVLMLLVRPHIALIAVASMLAAIALDPLTRRSTKIALVSVASIGLVYIAGTVEATLRVDLSSADSLSNFLAGQSQLGSTDLGGTTVIITSYPLRMLSLLFRPFFFDARSLMAAVASVENLIIVSMFLLLIKDRIYLIRALRTSFMVRYSVFFHLAIVLLLSAVYYNVGLGLRQKTMAMPALYMIVVYVWACRSAGETRRLVQQAVAAT